MSDKQESPFIAGLREKGLSSSDLEQLESRSREREQNPYLLQKPSNLYSRERMKVRVAAVVRMPNRVEEFLKLEKRSRTELFFVSAVGEQDFDNKQLFIESVFDYDYLLGEALLLKSPYMFTHVPELHTLDLLERLFSSGHVLKSMYFLDMFHACKVQSPYLCRLAVVVDAQCLRFVKEPSQELYDLAVAANPNALEFVPEEHQTESMILAAVQANPRVVRFVKDRGAMLKSAQLLAISITPQAIKNPDKMRIVPEVKLAYKSRCIKAGYYSKEWFDYLKYSEYDFTDTELITLFERMRDGDRYHCNEVFRLLPEDYRLQVALEWDLENSLPIAPVLVDMYVKQNNGQIRDKDMMQLIRVALVDSRSISRQTKSGILSWLMAKGFVSTVHNLLSQDGRLLQYLDKEYHTEQLCYSAVEQYPDALQYCYVMSERIVKLGYPY